MSGQAHNFGRALLAPKGQQIAAGNKPVSHQCNQVVPPSLVPPLTLSQPQPFPINLSRVSEGTRDKLVYVVVNVRRSSLEVPWGIIFSKFGDHIVLGGVNDDCRKRVSWSRVIFLKDKILDRKDIVPPVECTNATKDSYAQVLKAHFKDRRAGCKKHGQLLPGDLVLAADGKEAVMFRDLFQFTNYLRGARSFSLIVLRCPEATTTAIAYENPAVLTVPPPHNPYRAAVAADAIWRRVFNITMDTSLYRTPHPSTFTRQVTPDYNPYPPLARNPQHANGRRALCYPEIGHTISHTPALAAAQGIKPQAALGPSTGGAPASALSPLEMLSNVAVTSIASNNSFQRAKLASSTTLIPNQAVTISAPKTTLKRPAPLPATFRNSWFKDEHGDFLPFYDNWEFTPEDGQRARLFLPPISDFPAWLTRRKQQWRLGYNVYKCGSDNGDEEWQYEDCTVSHDFWTPQGFNTLEEWMSRSVAKWKLSYSWNRRKRQRIQLECEEVVHLSDNMEEFQHWLRIRRNQWRLQRRKRQRQRQDALTDENTYAVVEVGTATPSKLPVTTGDTAESEGSAQKKRKVLLPAINEIACIDVILEEEELQRKKARERPPLDIGFLFDPKKGAPDDVVFHCLRYLDRQEHYKLLCISKSTSNGMKSRNQVWRQLCPSHWTLPRRPRKPWHELYFHKLQVEERDSRKRWDDLLLKCANVMSKGDFLHKFEKLVCGGENDFGFDINYVSPVVCERNCLLNLAVINQRHKIARWLVDKRKPDVESYDRGHFTPLMNAAWAGDRQLVRLFLQRGADRAKIGYGHYSKALASPDFEGLTAEGWARRKGHNDIAELIRLGL